MSSLTTPPADALLWCVRVSRRRAAQIVQELAASRVPPRIGAVALRDGHLLLYIWTARPSRGLSPLLLGYEAFQLRQPAQIALDPDANGHHPAWLTGTALQLLLGQYRRVQRRAA